MIETILPTELIQPEVRLGQSMACVTQPAEEARRACISAKRHLIDTKERSGSLPPTYKALLMLSISSGSLLASHAYNAVRSPQQELGDSEKTMGGRSSYADPYGDL